MMDQIIFIWTGSNQIANQSSDVACFLLLGQLFQVMTSVPFYLSSAYGRTKLVFIVQLFSMSIIIPLLLFFIPLLGILGGGVAWLLMNLIIFIPYMYYLHNKIIKHQFQEWIIKDVLSPIIILVPSVFFLNMILPDTQNKIAILLRIAIICLISTIFLLLILKELRNDLKKLNF